MASMDPPPIPLPSSPPGIPAGLLDLDESDEEPSFYYKPGEPSPEKQRRPSSLSTPSPTLPPESEPPSKHISLPLSKSTSLLGAPRTFNRVASVPATAFRTQPQPDELPDEGPKRASTEQKRTSTDEQFLDPETPATAGFLPRRPLTSVPRANSLRTSSFPSQTPNLASRYAQLASSTRPSPPTASPETQEESSPEYPGATSSLDQIRKRVQSGVRLGASTSISGAPPIRARKLGMSALEESKEESPASRTSPKRASPKDDFDDLEEKRRRLSAEIERDKADDAEYEALIELEHLRERAAQRTSRDYRRSSPSARNSDPNEQMVSTGGSPTQREQAQSSSFVPRHRPLSSTDQQTLQRAPPSRPMPPDPVPMYPRSASAMDYNRPRLTRPEYEPRQRSGTTASEGRLGVTTSEVNLAPRAVAPILSRQASAPASRRSPDTKENRVTSWASDQHLRDLTNRDRERQRDSYGDDREKQTVHPPVQMAPPQQTAYEGRKPNAVMTVNRKAYQRLDLIGKGGSSRVYRVVGPDNAVYALKRVSLENADPTTIDSYRNEIKLLQRLGGNKRIIKLIDFDASSKKSILMVMECGEVDLAKLLSEKQGEPVDFPWVTSYWHQMLQAVQVIHDEKIVHTDLKPANFVLVKGSLKLIDFGIAKAIPNDTTNIQRDQQIGTVNYMSPEAIQGSQFMPGGAPMMKLGRASDVWSLGCILYQMIYGHPPFYFLIPYQKLAAIPDPNHIIDFPSSAVPVVLGPRDPQSGQPGVQRMTEHSTVVPPDIIATMSSCLQRDPKARLLIPELLSEKWNMNPNPEPRCDSPSEMLKPDEAVITDEQMLQLLLYTIKHVPKDATQTQLRDMVKSLRPKLREARKNGTK